MKNLLLRYTPYKYVFNDIFGDAPVVRLSR